jgi:hypothetical protein
LEGLISGFTISVIEVSPLEEFVHRDDGLEGSFVDSIIGPEM